MSLRFLLDTNVVSEPPRPAPNPGVLRKLGQYEGMVGIAAVVWHEMLFGLERLPLSRRRRDIENYLLRVVLKTMPILAYDAAAAEWHARQRARLVGMGKTPAYSDGQIAAVAKVNNLILVTANRAHFEPFDDLAIEDWRD
ncbi:MAG TPA: type II toxin-antitoxin system VapC family toxin [Thermoanaerobaculia bacterium]|nr:type II toxin-antitoxin system VapC family toxin [Thermoanaerobaculia bacterium]